VGLDVYVGPLVRYYLGNWANDVTQMFVENPEEMRQQLGENVTAFEMKTGQRSLAVSTVSEAIEVIRAWRSTLSESLGGEPLDWQESGEAGYFTRKPGWDSYQALILWAAYQEAGQPPPLIVPEDAEEDPLLRKSRAALLESKYPHLLGETEIWLPGPLSMTFRGPDPTGRKTDFGFAGSLFTELERLNQKTWQADLETIGKWYKDSIEPGSPLEACARFGFAVFHRLSATAYGRDLPMVLDY